MRTTVMTTITTKNNDKERELIIEEEHEGNVEQVHWHSGVC